jgi:hypothetical protein
VAKDSVLRQAPKNVLDWQTVERVEAVFADGASVGVVFSDAEIVGENQQLDLAEYEFITFIDGSTSRHRSR